MAPTVQIFSNIDRTESYGKDSFNMCLNFSSFKNFAVPYSRFQTVNLPYWQNALRSQTFPLKTQNRVFLRP
jgi:hypothetical protein